MLKKVFRSLFPFIVCFTVVALLCGIFRVEYLLNLVDSNYVAIAKIGGYISLLMSVLITAVYIVTVLGIVFFSLALMHESIDEYVLSGILRLLKYVSVLYSTAEILKLIFFMIWCNKNIPAGFSISTDQDVINIFTNTSLNEAVNIIDLCVLIIILAFSYYILHIKLEITYVKTILSTSVFFLLYVWSHYNFVKSFLL